jgi:hypothetical protein
MMKIALVVAAGVLTTAPLVTPVKAQGVKMAQVDMQTGRHYEDRDDRNYGDRRRYDSRRCHHRSTRALPDGDYQDRTGRRPQDHAQGARLRLNGEAAKSPATGRAIAISVG